MTRNSLYNFLAVDGSDASVAYVVFGDTAGIAAVVDEPQYHLVNVDCLPFAVDEVEDDAMSWIDCSMFGEVLLLSYLAVDPAGTMFLFVVALAD